MTDQDRDTTIRIKASTRERIKTYGHQGDTYDKTINWAFDSIQMLTESLAEAYRDRGAAMGEEELNKEDELTPRLEKRANDIVTRMVATKKGRVNK